MICPRGHFAMASNTSDGAYTFLAEPDSSLVCVVCLDVAEDPRQHETCGRLLCKECLEKRGRDKPCPNCRMEQPQYFEDNRGKREIMALQVGCNVNQECEWEGTVGTHKEHVATCEFALVPCPNLCTVDCFMRKDIEKHVKSYCPNRDYKCELCGKESTYADITNVHDQICERKILSCPNAGCGGTMERREMVEHLSNCLYTPTPCKYRRIGCDTELGRGEMAAHEQDDSFHLHMALDTVNSQQGIINSLEKGASKSQEATIHELQATTNLQQAAIELLQTKGKSPMTFALSQYQKKKEVTLSKSFTFPPFYTSTNGYNMKLMVYVNGIGNSESAHISVMVLIVDGKYDAGLKWPFTGSVTVTLLNQLEDNNHHSAIMSQICAVHTVKIGGAPVFITHRELGHDPVRNTQYLKDDTLYFRVSVEVPDYKPWLECRVK